MTTIIITIIATVFVYNFIGTIIYLATKENEGAVALWGLGLVALVTNAVIFIYSKIFSYWKRKNYKALLVDTTTDKRYYCNSNEADYFIYGDERFENLKFDRETIDNWYDITDGWRKKDCQKLGNDWLLSARYTPLKVCLEVGAEKLEKI